jgi:hypothetical protein
MRSKETIQQELTETRTRLSAYLAREADMLSKDGCSSTQSAPETCNGTRLRSLPFRT